MARRLDIELTSTRDDGTWTWRAAGARQPRGVIEPKLLDEAAKVGDVLRVEAQFELEGITILSVLPPRERVAPRDRIELVPRTAEGVGSVTTSLVARKSREGGRSGPAARSTRERRPGASSRPARPRERSEKTEAGEPRRAPRPRGPAKERAPREPSRRGDSAPPPRTSRVREAEAATRPTPQRRTRPPRLIPGTRHRDEFLSTLAPEERVVAEQLAIGGLPAVRKAIAEGRASAAASGRPEASGEAVVELAEQLLPGVRRAVWLDRAEAAVERLDTISMRDLRAAVVGGTPRDDHGRELLGKLREALQTRVEKQRTEWEADISRALAEQRVLHALRLSSRAPDPGARVSVALVPPLADAAGASLSQSTSPERWLALLEAAAASPVRRAVKPEGIPEDPSGQVRHSALLAAGRIPALAPMLGLAIPPPPRPAPLGAKPRPDRRPRPARRTKVQQAHSAEPDHAATVEPAVEETPPPADVGDRDQVAPPDFEAQSQTAEVEAGDDARPPTVLEAGGTDTALSTVVGEDAVVDEPPLEAVSELETPHVLEGDEAGVEGVVPGQGQTVRD